MSQSCSMLQAAAGACFVLAREAVTTPVAACKEPVSCALQPHMSATVTTLVSCQSWPGDKLRLGWAQVS